MKTYQLSIFVLLLFISDISLSSSYEIISQNITKTDNKTLDSKTNLSSMLRSIQSSLLRTEKLKHKMRKNLQRIRRKTREIKSKQMEISNQTEKSNFNETEKEISKISSQSKSNQLSLLTKFLQRINSLEEREYNEYKHEYQKEISKEKAAANKIAKKLMKSITNLS